MGKVLSATFTQGKDTFVCFSEPENTSLQPMTSLESDLILKFGKETKKGRGNGPEKITVSSVNGPECVSSG